MGWVTRAMAVLECQNEDLASKENEGDVFTRNILFCRLPVTLLKDASCPFIAMKLEFSFFCLFPALFIFLLPFSSSVLYLHSYCHFLSMYISTM